MTIVVCPLSRVSETIAAHAPARVISLLDPDTPFPETGAAYDGRHLRVSMHDITRVEEGWIAPGEGHIETLLHFLREWEPEAPLLVHCYAGISRSTATAFVAACLHNPQASEREIAAALRSASPTATPNRRIVSLADAALARKGRMTAAIDAIGRGSPAWPQIEAAEPFAIPSRFR
ncbi:MAG: tyrosine phosphatase family protein [Hyphomonadaceae bacterium]